MAGMLTKGMMATDSSQEPNDVTVPDTATQSMYHDYLTNPNSTYAQDPSLASQLKSATLPDVTPGTLSGSPATVAKQGLTPDAYSKVYGSTPDTQTYTPFNGQQVVTDDWFKNKITEDAKAVGEDPMAYDKRINPTTYGARWGVGSDQMGPSPTGVGAPGMTASGGIAPAAMRTYDAAQTAVTPGMLAAGNLASITDPNSQLMTQAATYGNQQANKRGLQNSSIGISAAQDAMLRAATPIAQQDASTQANVALSNTGALNQAGQFNAGAANTAALTAQQLTSQQTIAKAGNDTQIAVARMSSDTQQKMADIQQTNQKLLQSNSQAATAMSNYAATVANIQASKDMGDVAKQQAVDVQLTNLRNTLAALASQSGQDMTQFFPMIQQVTINPQQPPEAQSITDIRGY